MSYPFRLRSLTGSFLLETDADQLFVNIMFERFAKLPLGPKCVRRIKVADDPKLPVHQETLPWTIFTGKLTSTLWSPVTEYEGTDVVLGLTGFNRTSLK